MPLTPAELCLVIPVLNERDNIAPLVACVDAVLGGIAWEIIFVDDDSRDGTRAAIAAVAQTHPNVRLLHRIGHLGGLRAKRGEANAGGQQGRDRFHHGSPVCIAHDIAPSRAARNGAVLVWNGPTHAMDVALSDGDFILPERAACGLGERPAGL